jgi:uncharacterized protein YkwD
VRAIALVMLPALAWAQGTRYNDVPPAASVVPLAREIDALVAKVAHAGHRPVPAPDPRLDAAATEIVRTLPDRGPPANELVQGALWVHGIVEPPPQLVLTSMDRGGENELLKQLSRDLPGVLAQGRFTRVGVGLHDVGGDTHVVVALQESFVALEPIEREQPLGGKIALRGRLHSGFIQPEAFVTAPDGKVSRVALGLDPERFDASFRCGPDKGRFQIEVTGEDRFGATVVANFPVWCGVRAPTTVKGAAPLGGASVEGWTSAALAEPAMLKLLNADRARASLPPLAWDAQLATVARAHSADMNAHGFFGHVSPTTGTTGDRARKAGIDATLILENVARAFSAGEAERGLMNSPGHRANILSREVTRVGIGIVADETAHELLVTQLYARPPEKFGAHTADELRRAVDELRRAQRLRALDRDATLDELAESTALEMAQRGLPTSLAGRRIGEAMQAHAERWAGGHSLFAVVDRPAQVAESLKAALSEAGATNVGIGAEPGRRKDGPTALYVVIILATRR